MQGPMTSTCLAAPPQGPRPLHRSSVPHEPRAFLSLRGSPRRSPYQGLEGFSRQDSRESLPLDTRRKDVGRRVHAGPWVASPLRNSNLERKPRAALDGT